MIRLWNRQKRIPPPRTASKPAAVSGLIPLEPAAQLLQPAHRQALVRQIACLSRLPEAHFETLVQTAITHYARFVQRLSAFEPHARGGSLLDQGLEVTVTALRLRRGHLLPQGAEAEEIARQQDSWTYAVLTAALLHGIGRPVVEQRITLYEANGRRLGLWDPWAGPMDRIEACAGYRAEFLPQRQPELHRQVASLLASRILPPCGLSWLAREPGVLAAWLAALTGDFDSAGPFGAIIRQAISTSLPPEAGECAPCPAPPEQPLRARLLSGLRTLLSTGELSLNHLGAASWRVDEALWMVAERTAAALRVHLSAEGHDPGSNEQLLDSLHAQGVLVAQGDRPTWRARVSSDDGQDTLTLIRIPLQTLWPEPDTRPEPFAGTITPLENPSRHQAESHPPTPRTAGPAPVTGPAACAQSLPPALSAFPTPEHQLQAPAPPPPPEAKRAQAPTPAGEAPSEGDCGRQFLAWLREGIAAGEIEVNSASGRVHIVADGVLLASPGIFKDFTARHPVLDDWNAVQKRFLKLKLHRKTASGTTIHRYQAKDWRKKSVINGVLIPDATHLFGERPAPLPKAHWVPDLE